MLKNFDKLSYIIGKIDTAEEIIDLARDKIEDAVLIGLMELKRGYVDEYINLRKLLRASIFTRKGDL